MGVKTGKRKNERIVFELRYFEVIEELCLLAERLKGL